jgi:hypothetical protein
MSRKNNPLRQVARKINTFFTRTLPRPFIQLHRKVNQKQHGKYALKKGETGFDYDDEGNKNTSRFYMNEPVRPRPQPIPHPSFK